MLELFNKLTTLPEIESFIQGASAESSPKLVEILSGSRHGC
jgi:hypothetical protein